MDGSVADGEDAPPPGVGAVGGVGRRLGAAATRAPVIAGATWGVVWLMLTVTGQGYSLRAVYAGYQFVPAETLFDDPIGSVWNLHIQPPTWNLLIGLIGAAGPSGSVVGFQLLSLVLGVVLAATLCSTLGHLGAPRGVAIGLALVGSLTTQLLSHAFEPRYDFAVATVLSLLVWSVARASSGGVRWPVLVPVLLATSLVSMRTLYHPVWLVGVVAIVAWSFRSRVTIIELAAAAAIPLVAVGAIMVKNEIVVDRFTLSTLTGMNLERSISPAVPTSDLRAMTDQGRISDIWERGVADWALARPCEAEPGDHPVLSAPYRTLPPEWQTGPFDDGIVPNLNARCFLPAFDQAADDAGELMRAHPEAWLRGRAWALNNWFGVLESDPAETSPLWEPMDVLSRVVLVGIPHPPLPASWQDEGFWVQSTPISLVHLVLTAVVLAAAVVRLRPGRDQGEDPGRVPILLTGWIVLWTLAVGVVFELGEQVRFRNAIDPLVIAVGGWLALAWARRAPGHRDDQGLRGRGERI